jgi:hypothetical protein
MPASGRAALAELLEKEAHEEIEAASGTEAAAWRPPAGAASSEAAAAAASRHAGRRRGGGASSASSAAAAAHAPAASAAEASAEVRQLRARVAKLEETLLVEREEAAGEPQHEPQPRRRRSVGSLEPINQRKCQAFGGIAVRAAPWAPTDLTGLRSTLHTGKGAFAREMPGFPGITRTGCAGSPVGVARDGAQGDPQLAASAAEAQGRPSCLTEETPAE